MTKKFRAIKTVEFDYGHRVPKHNSKCRNIHGHRGRLEVTVEGCLITSGSSTDMVMDFGDVKKLMEREIVERLDHCCVIDAKDDKLKALFRETFTPFPGIEKNGFGKRYDVLNFGMVQELDAGSPTAEILAFVCYEILEGKMPEGVCLKLVRFWETPSSVAEYSGATESFMVANPVYGS